MAEVRRLFALTILLIFGLWLLFSYVPSWQTILPTIAFRKSSLWMAGLAVPALVIFVAIQVWLVYTTDRTVRMYQAKDEQTPFRLHLGVEFFWTALPIAMTIGLAWASYPLWINLVQP